VPEELMPQLPLPGDDAVQLDKKYVILAAEPFHSEVQGYKGARITLDGGTDALLAIPLWYRETVGSLSKFGSFILALGNDMNQWVGKTIIFKEWTEKNRIIEVV